MPKQLFTTADLPLVAFLRLHNYTIVKIDKESNGRAIFTFEDDLQRETLTFQFFNKETSVEPLTFLDQMRGLKSLINQGRGFKKPIGGAKEA